MEFWSDDWWEKERKRILKEFEEINKALEKAMKRAFREFEGGERPRVEPRIYGFSLSIGPDGRPVFREFGNIRPRPEPEIRAVREPIVEVYEEKDEIVVLAETPGVSEEDIEVKLSGNVLEIKAGRGERRYNKMLSLDKPVSGIKGKSYRNGVLEVRLKKK